MFRKVLTKYTLGKAIFIFECTLVWNLEIAIHSRLKYILWKFQEIEKKILLDLQF